MNEKELLELEKEKLMLENENHEHELALAQSKQQAQSQESLPEVGSLESTARGLGQGLTLGFSDEMLAAGQAGLGALQGEQGGIMDLYRKYRDMQRQREKAASEQHGTLYTGGEIAGGLASTLGSGGAGLLGKAGLKSLGKMAVGDTLKTAVQGGALYGLGSTEADVTKGELGQAAKDVAIGATLGGVGQQVGEKILAPAVQKYITPKLSGLSTKLHESAEDQALRSLGGGKAEFEKELFSQKFKGIEGEKRGLGEEALERIKGGQDIEHIHNKLINDIDAIEKQKSNIFKNIEPVVQLAKHSPEAIPVELSANNIENIYAKNLNSYINRYSSETPELKNRIMKDFEHYGKELSSRDYDINALNSYKAKLNQNLTDIYTKPSHELTPKEEFYKGMVKTINERIEQMVDTYHPNGGDAIRNLNKQESILIDLKNAAWDKIVNNRAAEFNEGFVKGTIGTIGATLGYKAGGPVGSAIGLGTGMLVGKTIRGQAGARSLESASKYATHLASGLETYGKAVPQAIARANIESTATTPAEQLKQNRQIDAAKTETQKANAQINYAKTDELAQYVQTLRQDPSMTRLADTVEIAINSGDENKRKAAKVMLMMNPKARKMLGM